MEPNRGKLSGRGYRTASAERRAGRLVAPFLISGLAMSACSPVDTEGSAVATAQPAEVRLAPNSCIPPAEYRDVANATDCLRKKNMGQVALVAFSGSSEKVEEVAEAIEQTIAGITYDDLTPDVEVVWPSPEARSAHDQIASEGCVDDSKTDIATIARRHMPSLNEDYDYVIGVTPLPNCNPSVAGVAYWMNNNSDVYKYDDANTNGAIHVGTHELGHLYGLGHAGSEYRHQLTYTTAKDLVPEVDFSRLRNTVDYVTYGEWTIMGQGHPHNPNRPLNSVQLHSLAWPERTLGHDGVGEMKPLDNSTVRLDGFGDPISEIAVLNLLNPLTSKVENSNAQIDYVAFDKLAVQYVSREMTNGQYIPRAYLTLMSDHGLNDTLSLAELEDSWDREEGARSLVVKIGSQSLLVSFSENELIIKDTTNYDDLAEQPHSRRTPV